MHYTIISESDGEFFLENWSIFVMGENQVSCFLTRRVFCYILSDYFYN